MTDDLQAMFRHLDGLTGRPDLARLTEELSRFSIELDDLAEYLHFSPATYKRNLVRAGPYYHAWVLCWKNGQRSPIHDHRGSSVRGAGAARHADRDAASSSPPTATSRRCSRADFAAGSVIGSEDADIHQVSNLQAGDADLVTLHVYSPPLHSDGDVLAVRT